MNSIFIEITLVLILAGAIAYMVSLLKQPSIVAYIITGLIVGPLGYYKLHNGTALSGLAQIGITLLLFMVGLELDVTQLKKLGKNVLLAGMGQVVVTSAVGFGILRLLGFTTTSSLFIAPALTFSSTIIVVKLLSEKRDLQSLYGKLVIGIFLTQDLVSIIILIGLSTLSPAGSLYSSLPVWQNIIMVCVRALILVLITMWLSAKVFPKVLKHIGKNDELLLLFALAWALGLAAFVSAPFMGFSLEIGGFLAGLSLAQTGVHYEISSRIKPIRDFFIIIFFVVLGSGLVFTHLSILLLPAAILSLFVLVGNPLIIMLLLGLLGYKPRTSFFAGVTVAQISEFSLILVALGYELGFLQAGEVGLVTMIGIITISLSSYMIQYAGRIYEYLKPWLAVFDFRKGFAEKHLAIGTIKNHIVLIGAHRLGHHLIEALIKQKSPFIIIDFNPEVVEHYIEQGLPAICGDITDSYIQEQAHIESAKLIISTVPDYSDNLALLEAVKKITSTRRIKPKLIFMAQDEEEIKALYKQDIDYVVSPHFMGGLHLAKILEGKELSSGLKKLRDHHLKILNS
jgi:Kef-type K+ transport system membrane component KefB/voltage-gated potassium channel Kch